MACPINPEEVAKLKLFIQVVSAQPQILNLPQLDFFKKFIEQLGGKVPEGGNFEHSRLVCMFSYQKRYLQNLNNSFSVPKLKRNLKLSQLHRHQSQSKKSLKAMSNWICLTLLFNLILMILRKWAMTIRKLQKKKLIKLEIYVAKLPKPILREISKVRT